MTQKTKILHQASNHQTRVKVTRHTDGGVSLWGELIHHGRTVLPALEHGAEGELLELARRFGGALELSGTTLLVELPRASGWRTVLGCIEFWLSVLAVSVGALPLKALPNRASDPARNAALRLVTVSASIQATYTMVLNNRQRREVGFGLICAGHHPIGSPEFERGLEQSAPVSPSVSLRLREILLVDGARVPLSAQEAALLLPQRGVDPNAFRSPDGRSLADALAGQGYVFLPVVEADGGLAIHAVQRQ